MGKANIRIDVFISRDAEIAAAVYNFLTGKGLSFPEHFDTPATVLLAIGTVG